MRPVLYISVAVLLVILTIEGVREAASYRSETQARERTAAQAQLDTMIDQFEAGVSDRVRSWLGELRAPLPLGERQEIIRGSTPWFDAFYLWEGGEMAFPPDPVAEDLIALRANPCVEEAGRVGASGDLIRTAVAYRVCLGQGRGVGLFAASEATERLLNADQPKLAEEFLHSLAPFDTMPLAHGVDASVSARRLLALRLQHIRAMTMRGQEADAERWLAGTLTELLTLDAPTFDVLRDLYEYPMLDDLKRARGHDAEDTDARARAERRVLAWREIHHRTWVAADAPQWFAGPRLLVDPYDDPPWILLYARLDVNELMGAVQLDQPALIAWFLRGVPARLRSAISIRDSDDSLVVGESGPLVVYRTFSQTLPHITVGFTSAVSIGGTERTLVVQILPVLLGLVLGTLALLGMVASDREQVRLLARQRDFMTRVTHELKTPLAGVRLMAETMEMGAYKGTEDVSRFSGRIIAEVDRLHARVDEIIRAAGTPDGESATLVDAQALLRDVAARWRPLIEAQGGRLEVEADNVGTIQARPALLRDALSNLLDNAIKYQRSDRPLRVVARVHGDRRTITFEVEDNGMGVPASMRAIIFEKFRRVEGPDRGKAGGHGLGLAFVAQAARVHRGRVECRDGSDGGARFLLKIRRAS